MGMDNHHYRDTDYYADAKHSTERITDLNERRRYWVRVQWAANALLLSGVTQTESEKPLEKFLNKIVDVSKSRIAIIDKESEEALRTHERIMQALLER
jgi:hypothetical protein